MKKFLVYCYKHLSTVITLLITIAVDIYLNVSTTVTLTLTENFLMAGLIALNLTFLFDFTKNMDSMDKKLDDLKNTFPSSSIETFPSVDLVAEQLTELVHEGDHQVDIVLYDIKVRTSDPQKVSKMNQFLKLCSENSRIKLRLAFVPAADSICQRINNIIEAENKHSNSFYAYQESTITFASFMIIDGSFVSIRTPHKNGSPSLYCVVKEEDLCNLYSSWFNILWEEASHVDKGNLNDFITKYKHLIPQDKFDAIKKKL